VSEATITTRQLCKRYEESGDASAWAIYDISAQFFAGQVTVLKGPSGSGKTTLLSLIGGLLGPTSGTLDVLGARLDDMNEDRRQKFRRSNVGFVFQSYNLLAALTAEQNVRLALGLRGANEGGAQDLLEKVGLGHKAESYPVKLSGGERQRVAIARALAGNPALLLADEPTAALDAGNGRRVMKLLQWAARELNTTVIVVTHDHRVLEHADRVVELEDGVIMRTYRLVRKPAHAGAGV
jgi:putative ABC transport system ATP-binding protein